MAETRADARSAGRSCGTTDTISDQELLEQSGEVRTPDARLTLAKGTLTEAVNFDIVNLWHRDVTIDQHQPIAVTLMALLLLYSLARNLYSIQHYCACCCSFARGCLLSSNMNALAPNHNFGRGGHNDCVTGSNIITLSTPHYSQLADHDEHLVK
jgi:hypothetical protein